MLHYGPTVVGVSTLYVSRLVLSRGSVGKIECDAPYESDNKTCDKYGGEANRCNVAVVEEGEQNGGYHCESEAQYMTLQIDRFAWLTLHVRRVPSGMSSTFLHCSLEGGANTAQFSTLLSKGVAKAALYCAYRTSIF
jgi:hypothetical protein